MLVLREKRVIDDRAIGAARLELGRGLAQVWRVPETRPHLAALRNNLLLLHQLGEEDVEREDRHQNEDGEHRNGDNADLLESGDQAVWIRSCCGSCCLHNGTFLLKAISKTRGASFGDT